MNEIYVMCDNTTTFQMSGSLETEYQCMKQVHEMWSNRYEQVKDARNLQRALFAIADNTTDRLAAFVVPVSLDKLPPLVAVPKGVCSMEVRQTVVGKCHRKRMEVPKKVKYFCFDWDFEPLRVEVELRDAGYDEPFTPAHVTYKRGWDIQGRRLGNLGRLELEEHDMWVRNLIFRQRTTWQRPFTWSDPDTRGKFWRMNDVPMLMFFQTSKQRRRVVLQQSRLSAVKLAWMAAVARARKKNDF